MKYRAKLEGFIGGRRIRAGQVFEFEGKKPGKWMEPVKDARPDTKGGKPAKQDKPAEPDGNLPSNQEVI